MNIYSILFERLYVVFHKGVSVNPSHEKQDGAVLTSMIMSIPVYYNLLSIFHLVRVFQNFDLHINSIYGAVVIVMLMIFNLFYFLRKKKYLALCSEMANISKKKRIIYTILSWSYFLGSFILFFFLLNLVK